MIWQQDQELMQWLLNIHPLKAGDFLKSIAESAMRADCENYPILRPALLELKAKYPQYGAAFTHVENAQANPAPPRTNAEAVVRESGYWLPDNCIVKLTAIELGALHMLMLEAKKLGHGRALIKKPGPDGEPITVTLIDRMLDKIEDAREAAETAGAS